MAQTRSRDKPLHEYPVLSPGGNVVSHYGISSSPFNALSWQAGDIVLIPAGRFLLFANIVTGEVEAFEGPVAGGIGTVAVHPSQQFFVVGERGPEDPRLLIYEWPSRKEVGQFDGVGCTVGYAASCFDRDGTRVATVAAAPDFTLAVWDWKTRSMALRSKCFSSDVYTVCFSAFDNSLLVTGGSGHLKFWTMSETFTGLKLQGTLGKFGRLEISNVSGFAVLPDGKVLSGSEGGNLLMWEGDLVKCSFVRRAPAYEGDDFTPCHGGAINVVVLVHDAKVVATFGDDGWIRYWSREELELAEGEGVPPMHAPHCIAEVRASSRSGIRAVTLQKESATWILLDHLGNVTTSRLPSLEECLDGSVSAEDIAVGSTPLHFNGGGLLCCATSPVAHVAVTGGEDGVVRLFDYLTGAELAHVGWGEAEAAEDTVPSGVSSLGIPVTWTRFFAADPKHSHLIAGFGDGTVRLLELVLDPVPQFSLLGQWRPHVASTFAVAVSADERALCTVSEEGTAFFFEVASSFDELKPVGFCRLPLPHPTCADWDEANRGCFIGFAGGEVLAVKMPAEGEVAQDLSFEFPCSYSLIGIRQRRVPPPVPEDEQNAVEEEDDILEEKDDGPWGIAMIRSLADGSILIGMDKAELLYRYHASVRYADQLALPPLPATGVEPPNYVEDPEENVCYRDMVPQATYLGPSGKELIIVCKGAQVIVRHAADPSALCSDGAAVSLVTRTHDSTRGCVTGAQTSFDGSILVTTGTDGTIVAQLLAGKKKPGDKQRPPSAKPAEAAEPAPVAAPPLSIQQQKEADDQEREETEKERRRQEFLSGILALQRRHAELLKTNVDLPAQVRIPAEELHIDATLEDRLRAEQERRVAEARQEYAVESAREGMRTKKLKNRFIDNLLWDRFLVRAFRSGFSVGSFRTPDPAMAITRMKRNIDALGASDGSGSDEEAQSSRSTMAPRGDGTDGDTPDVCADAKNGSEATANAPGRARTGNARTKMNATVAQQLQKSDERREERQARRRGYAALLAGAPDPAEDAAFLAHMEKRDLEERGECVLRTDPEYKGRRDYRPTASAKLDRMIYLESLLVEKRVKFNERLSAAREKKRSVIAMINKYHARIREIDHALDEHTEGAETLTMHPEEEPEKVFEIGRTGLEAFAKQKELERLKEEEDKKAQRGFGADLAEAPKENRHSSVGSKPASDTDQGPSPSSRRATVARGESRSKGSRNASRLARGSRQSTSFLSPADRDRIEMEMKAKRDNIKRSELEEEEEAMRREELSCERNRLLRSATDAMQQFDDDLYSLYREHVDVDADLCLGDAHLLLLFREFQLLLVFRNRDRELRGQLRAAKGSRETTQKLLHSLQHEIQTTEGTLAQLQEHLKQHKREAEAYIQEASPADRVSYLLKIFNRHIKRRRGNLDGEDNDDITSDDEDEEFDDDDSDIGEEICPPNCDVSVWEQVLALRETRLDINDDLTDTRKKQEESNKQLTKHNTELENIIKEVKGCHDRIAELESEKRRQLNLLNTVVPLRCSQVKCLDSSGAVPLSLWNQNVTVVSDAELHRLEERVVQLASQKEARREEIQSMAAELQRLQMEKADAQKVHADWESQVHEVMMLKFGRLVDLEMLESCGTSHRIEEKKEELRRTELRWDREIRKRENHIAALRDELQAGLLHNTHLLQELGDYESERQAAERTLTKASTGVAKKFRGAKVATETDRANLRTLIAAQQEEMDALNAEISMLKRKGGHAYSPAMPY